MARVLTPSGDDADFLLCRFHDLAVWSRGGERAPHKPLLVLMALARLLRGEGRLVSYREVDEQLRRLLIDFGPDRKSYHPEYPFWRLQADGLWEVPERDEAERRRIGKRTGDVPPKVLLEVGAHGGFVAAVQERLVRDHALARRIAREILEAHFPSSIHDDLRAAVGMREDAGTDLASGEARRRDPEFRSLILRIYEHRCVVCGYDGRLGNADLALEAAHVMWHAAGGPDLEDNGIALCSLHHKVFDRGGISLDEKACVLVSEHVVGSGDVIGELILRFAGKAIRQPLGGHSAPADRHVEWHRREVFRGPPRVGG